MEVVNYQEMILTYNEYIVKVEKGCLYIANELRQGNKNALNEIINFSEGMEWLILVSRELKNENIETNLNEKNLLTYLKEINDAIQQDDLYLVADLFEYEIAAYFKNPAMIEG